MPTPDGKLTPELIDRRRPGAGATSTARSRRREHHPDHRTRHLYTPAEVTAIADYVHERGMVLHMDGARHLRMPRRPSGFRCAHFTTDAGVDILSFGGTKNGLIFGEAIVVLDPVAVRGADLPAQAQHAARVEDALR